MPEQKQQEQKRYSIKAYADTEHEQITIEITQNMGFGYSVFVFESDFLDFEYADRRIERKDACFANFTGMPAFNFCKPRKSKGFARYDRYEKKYQFVGDVKPQHLDGARMLIAFTYREVIDLPDRPDCLAFGPPQKFEEWVTIETIKKKEDSLNKTGVKETRSYKLLDE